MEKKLIGVPRLNNYSKLDGCFKCGVCKFPLFLAPVITCNSAGSLCAACAPGYHQPFRSPIKPDDDDAVRHRAYEELVSLVSFPCCFRPCNVLVDAKEQSIDHFSVCRYGTILCPLSAAYRSYLYDLEDQCEWEGLTHASLVEHIQEAHSKYILTDNPPTIDLKQLNFNIKRKLFIVINSPEVISLIMIDYWAMRFTIAFRQGRPVESSRKKVDICYFELIPSRKKGYRLWSYLYSGPLYGPLSSASEALVFSNEQRIIQLHIEEEMKTEEQPIEESPKFYFSPEEPADEPKTEKETNEEDNREESNEGVTPRIPPHRLTGERVISTLGIYV